MLAAHVPAWAHAPAAAESPPTLATAFSLEPWLLPSLAVALCLYIVGVRRLWRTGAGRGVTRSQALSFLGGWCVLGLALLWPLDAYGAWSLAAHMTQHMLLAALAPPLLLLGKPGPVWLAALPAHVARGLTAPARGPAGRRLWRRLAAPGVATLLLAVVMWVWHLPRAMELALRDDAIHYAMHLSFLGAGLVFWAAMLRSLREPTTGAMAGLVAVVATMMQMGLLGALLTFSGRPWYPYYFDRAPRLGLEPLADQQLAGLIMWVPAALPYLVGGLVLTVAWLRRSERHGAAGPGLQEGTAR